MQTWKKIPTWFKLDNYRDSINFTAREWLDEISARQQYADILINPGNFSEHLFDLEDLSVEAEEAIRFFNLVIKQRPLVSMKFDLNNSRVEEVIKSWVLGS